MYILILLYHAQSAAFKINYLVNLFNINWLNQSIIDFKHYASNISEVLKRLNPAELIHYIGGSIEGFPFSQVATTSYNSWCNKYCSPASF